MTEPVARIRIELQNIEPVIWRRVDLPVCSSLATLHDVIQATFLWENAHLFEFRIGEKVYGQPPPHDDFFDRRVHRATSLRLRALLERGISLFLYIYDFGDDWRHDVLIEQTFTGEADVDYPRFVDGKRAAPPEDVGGAPGFFEFVEAIRDRSHPGHVDARAWCGGSFDPNDIGGDRIRERLVPIVRRRRLALDRHHASQIAKKS